MERHQFPPVVDLAHSLYLNVGGKAVSFFSSSQRALVQELLDDLLGLEGISFKDPVSQEAPLFCQAGNLASIRTLQS